MGFSFRRLTAVLATLFVLAAGFGAAPATAAAKSRTLSLSVSNTQPLVGSRVAFTGKLTRSPAGSKVDLERKRGKKWVKVATVRTTKTGAYSYSVKAVNHGSQSWRARAPKSKNLKSVHSATLKLSVYRRAAITLTATTLSVTAGSPVTLRGKASPYKAGTKVTLQRRAGQAWVADGSPATVSGAGAYSFTRVPADSTTYRALVARTSTFIASAVSAPVNVTVTAQLPTGVTRISVTSDGAQANGAASDTAISANGRYVAFLSDAKNLVAGDTGDTGDDQEVFVRDRLNQTTELISRTASGSSGNDSSSSVSISGDGRYVSFDSLASDLVSGDNNHQRDVFVFDRTTAKMTLVSKPSDGLSDGMSFDSQLSADGSCVVYASGASNLEAADGNDKQDVFVTKLADRSTTLVSATSSGAGGNEDSHSPSVDGDCGRISFTSAASNLVADDDNWASDVFVRDLAAKTTKLISRASNGALGDAGAGGVSAISADGKFVAYPSDATNLVDGDENQTTDVFVTELKTGNTERVSVSSGGTEAEMYSQSPSLSADGRFVSFESFASNLVDDDESFDTDVFVHDRQTHKTVMASVNFDLVKGNFSSDTAQLSADGKFVTFLSTADNLVDDDTNYLIDAFVADVSRLF